MRRRAYTLIELMIVVAIIGITAALAGGTGSEARMRGIAEIQQQQALLLAEYVADHEASGRPTDDLVLARLAEPLPDVSVTRAPAGPATTIEIRWRDPFGREVTRSLTSFRRAR